MYMRGNRISRCLQFLQQEGERIIAGRNAFFLGGRVLKVQVKVRILEQLCIYHLTRFPHVINFINVEASLVSLYDIAQFVLEHG